MWLTVSGKSGPHLLIYLQKKIREFLKIEKVGYYLKKSQEIKSIESS